MLLCVLVRTDSLPGINPGCRLDTAVLDVGIARDNTFCATVGIGRPK